MDINRAPPKQPYPFAKLKLGENFYVYDLAITKQALKQFTKRSAKRGAKAFTFTIADDGVGHICTRIR